MQKSLYNRLFPVPNFLSMPAFGIDISDETLRYVQLVETKNGVGLGKYGHKEIPSGIIDAGRIIDPAGLRSILASLLKEEGVRYARVSLPEEQAYIIKLSLPKEGLSSVREGVELTLEEYIPIPAQEAVFDYEIIGETKDSLDLQVAAMQANVANSYLSVFAEASLFVKSLEIEAQAISRAVIPKGEREPYMIVDFGEHRTGIFIVANEVVSFTSTLDFGGEVLSQMIQKSFDVSKEEAEKMKKHYGLQRNLGNKEIFPVLLNGISILRDEIVKHMLYWQTHTDEQGKKNSPIKKIFLCGGNANIVGLPDYFSVSMKTKVEIADVWTNIKDFSTEGVPDINSQEALSYVTALGLALGDF